MQQSWNNNQTYYRCTYSRQYALANEMHYPREDYDSPTTQAREQSQHRPDWVTHVRKGRVRGGHKPLANALGLRADPWLSVWPALRRDLWVRSDVWPLYERSTCS